MKKVLYLLPAVLVCMVYGLLSVFVLAGDTGAFNPVVIAYIVLPVIGSALLMRNKWWGCLLGIAMGGLMVSNYLGYDGHQHVNLDFVIGTSYMVYYALMGFLCAVTNRKK